MAAGELRATSWRLTVPKVELSISSPVVVTVTELPVTAFGLLT
jgi:hypothetical protein